MREKLYNTLSVSECHQLQEDVLNCQSKIGEEVIYYLDSF